MILSVVIVNYNVKYFLEQCLLSVRKASQNLAIEVFVVDNNSIDGSCDVVKEKFPEVKLIENKTNTGFAMANNQAIKLSTGKYVLLLNPDTVVEEDTFQKIISFMESHPDAGALGVHMIDGKGNFLPESKRGLPVPSVAFYKISGLAALFPKSKTFGKYHLGFLDKNKIQEVDVLSGAFMLLRKTTLEKTGLLDETFFMYGEDIDLSYRIQKAGYKNYYFPETKIIHYKGESTKKSSVNYVVVFYRAMAIFAKKHFTQRNAALFSSLVNIAIFLRACAAVVSRLVDKLFVPFLDFIIIYGGFYFLKIYWEQKVKELDYPAEYMYFFVPGYVLVWMLWIYFSGGYQRPVNISKIIRGIFSGTVFILVCYALLNEEYRYSRALILLGTLWAIIGTSALRFLLGLTGAKTFALASDVKKKLIIVAKPDEAKRILSLLQLAGSNTSFVGFIADEKSSDLENFNLGNIQQLEEITEVYSADEIIFSARDYSSNEIISRMLQVKNRNVEFKIAPPESMFIIGSNSINRQGDFYFVDINALTNPVNQRNKRICDLLVCIVMIPAMPFLLLKIKNTGQYISNWLLVLAGKYSWVGLAGKNAPERNIKKGILNPADGRSAPVEDPAVLQRLNLFYAKEYKIQNDLLIITKGLKNLGRKIS